MGVFAGSALLCLGLLYPQIFARGGVVSYNHVTQYSDALRMTVHDVGLSMFQAHPFLGIGFNNYMLAFPNFTHGQTLPATYIHNVYLHLGVEVGLFGLLSFLIFCFWVLIKGWKNRQRPEVLTCLCIFAGLLTIGIVDFYPLCQQEIRLIFFLAAGFLAAPNHQRTIVRSPQ
jgi:O-antigen ligase